MFGERAMGEGANIAASSFADLSENLSVYGIKIAGAFVDEGARVGLLLINHDRSFWDAFVKSSQFMDGKADPMDRWCVEVLSSLSERYSCEWKHPSHKPYQPFQKWALQIPQVATSLLGMLIHQEYGLHWGMRGALFPCSEALIDESQLLVQDAAAMVSPCETCVERPCMKTCPVQAHGDTGFDVVACKGYLSENDNSVCMMQGCLARNACPLASPNNIPMAQRQFHMRAFSP